MPSPTQYIDDVLARGIDRQTVDAFLADHGEQDAHRLQSAFYENTNEARSHYAGDSGNARAANPYPSGSWGPNPYGAGPMYPGRRNVYAERAEMTPSFDNNLPPGVPPGSVSVNGGANPNAWAYQTPDGRIIRGSRGGGWTTADLANTPGVGTPSYAPNTPQLGNGGQPPVFSTMPVRDPNAGQQQYRSRLMTAQLANQAGFTLPGY